MALPERLSSELFSLLPRTGARRGHACRHTRYPWMTDPSCALRSSSHRGSAAATKLFPSSTQPAGCCQCAANHKQRRTTRTLQSPIRALSVHCQFNHNSLDGVPRPRRELHKSRPARPARPTSPPPGPTLFSSPSPAARRSTTR